MDPVEFKKSARFIAKNNANERVAYVVATFDDKAKHLLVIHCLYEKPNDGDQEWCDLTCGELIADFPDIVTAETKCLTLDECDCGRDYSTNIVFSRE